MKIVKLSTENVKRLSAVTITPDGTLVTVGGRNGAGKSSVLDSISYALGGEKLVPSQPIRKGEREAKIVVDLGDYVVTRKFSRDPLPCDCGVTHAGDMPIVGDEQMHTKACASHNFGPTKSTLTVTNPEGAKYPSPQALLDKLYGKLTFDPLAFSNEAPAKQGETLRKLTNLDFTPLDTRRKTLFDQRAMAKKTLAIQQAKLGGMVHHPDAPTIEVSTAPLQARMASAQQAIAQTQTDQRARHAAQKALELKVNERTNTEERLDYLRRELAEAEERYNTLTTDVLSAETLLRDAESKAEASAAAVPDMAELSQELADTEVLNMRVRENKMRMEQEAVVALQLAQIEELTGAIAAVDESKDAALAAAKFPIDGLSLSDEGVVYEGLPLKEVSSSVQLRVSVAIGLALNPTLKVLLIRNGNLLDADSLQAVAEQAEAAGAQVWMEYVTASSDGMSVMLVDGHAE